MVTAGTLQAHMRGQHHHTKCVPRTMLSSSGLLARDHAWCLLDNRMTACVTRLMGMLCACSSMPVCHHRCACSRCAAIPCHTRPRKASMSRCSRVNPRHPPPPWPSQVLKSWLHLPYGWCYTPLPNILVFPKLEIMVVAATIPGAAQVRKTTELSTDCAQRGPG